MSEDHFLLWRTDNMWSSDPEDRAIVYIRKLNDDGLTFHQVGDQKHMLKGKVKYTGELSCGASERGLGRHWTRRLDCRGSMDDLQVLLEDI